jgi:hypothetical protein
MQRLISGLFWVSWTHRILVGLIACVCFEGALAAPPPGPDYVCVRNFVTGLNHDEVKGVNNPQLIRVIPADGSQTLIYTKSYAASFCTASPQEFKWVQAASGETICTCDFHQEGVAEYCYSNPKIFAWALKAEGE